MPFPGIKPGSELEQKIDRCITRVQSEQPKFSKGQAIAICRSSIEKTKASRGPAEQKAMFAKMGAAGKLRAKNPTTGKRDGDELPASAGKPKSEPATEKQQFAMAGRLRDFRELSGGNNAGSVLARQQIDKLRSEINKAEKDKNAASEMLTLLGDGRPSGVVRRIMSDFPDMAVGDLAKITKSVGGLTSGQLFQFNTLLFRQINGDQLQNVINNLPNLLNAIKKSTKETLKRVSANYSARAGENITPNLRRGGDGEFESTGQSTTAISGLSPTQLDALKLLAQGKSIQGGLLAGMLSLGLVDKSGNLTPNGKRAAEYAKGGDIGKIKSLLGSSGTGDGKGGKKPAGKKGGGKGGGKKKPTKQEIRAENLNKILPKIQSAISKAEITDILAFVDGEDLPAQKVKSLAKKGLISLINGKPTTNKFTRTLVSAIDKANSRGVVDTVRNAQEAVRKELARQAAAAIKRKPKKKTATKSKVDAVSYARYRPAGPASTQICQTCKFKSDNTKLCTLYDFSCDDEYVCDSWLPDIEALKKRQQELKVSTQQATGNASPITAHGNGGLFSKPLGTTTKASRGPAELKAMFAKMGAAGKLRAKGPGGKRTGKKISPDTKIETRNASGGGIVVTSRIDGNQGRLDAIHLGDTLEIVGVEIDNPSLKGTGMGKKMYADVLNYARENNLLIKSDETVEIGAIRVWESLRSQGIPVQKSKKAKSDKFDGDLFEFTTDGSPVYSVDYRNQNTQKATFTVFKDTNGKPRWLSVSSSSYRDKDGEIVSLKAITTAVEANDLNGHGPLRWWHLKGVDLGTTDLSIVIGKMLVESGTFVNELVAQKVKENIDKLGMSIGFKHPITEPDREGVFHNINIFERSILPKEKASNHFTKLTVKGDSNNMASQQEKLAQLASLLGDGDVLQGFINSVKQTDKEAEAIGIAHKEVNPTIDELMEVWHAYKEAEAEFANDLEQWVGDEKAEDTAEEKMEEKMEDKGGMKPLTVAEFNAGINRLAAMIQGVGKSSKEVEAIETINTRLQELESQKEALQQQLDELNGAQPRALSGYRASQQAEPVAEPHGVDEATKELQELAQGMGHGSEMLPVAKTFASLFGHGNGLQ